MEKLIHTPSGELISDDPFRKVGTKFKWYYDNGDYGGEGVVTKEALEKHDDPNWSHLKDSYPIWANFRGSIAFLATAENQYRLEIVETGGSS